MGQAFCYQGTCTTHDDQCKLLWGPSGKRSDDQCYAQNRKGTRHGNCGYNRLNSSFIGCTDVDVQCGMLHCSHLSERLEFGMESVAILSHSFINSGGKIIPCRAALVDLGLNNVDPGLAPEGARCGDGALCVNQRCIPVGSLAIGPNSCPYDCNGHGLCNSLGHCHCDVGYSPPYCDAPGPGGSEDSGPASDPDEASVIGIVLLVCLAVVCCTALCFVVYLRCRNDIKRFVDKTAAASSAAGADKKKKRHSTLDISGPMDKGAVKSTGSSSSSSPTHALLPHADTTTSGLNSESDRKSSTNEQPPRCVTRAARPATPRVSCTPTGRRTCMRSPPRPRRASGSPTSTGFS